MKAELECSYHSNIVKTICAKEDCTYKRLCTQCFKTHDPSHLQFFVHMEDLTDEKLENFISEISKDYIIPKSILEEMKNIAVSKLQLSIQNFIKKAGDLIYEKYSESILKSLESYGKQTNKVKIKLTEEFKKTLTIEKSIEDRAELFIKLENLPESLRKNKDDLEQEINYIFNSLENVFQNLKAELTSQVNYFLLNLKLSYSIKLDKICKLIFDEESPNVYSLNIDEDKMIRFQPFDKLKENEFHCNYRNKYVIWKEQKFNSIIIVNSIFFIFYFNELFKYENCELVDSHDTTFLKIKKHNLLYIDEDRICLIHTKNDDKVSLAFFDSQLKLIEQMQLDFKITFDFYTFFLNGKFYFLNLITGLIEYFYDTESKTVIGTAIKVESYIKHATFYKNKLFIVNSEKNLNVYEVQM
jgi:hypothetical protein